MLVHDQIIVLLGVEKDVVERRADLRMTLDGHDLFDVELEVAVLVLELVELACLSIYVKVGLIDPKSMHLLNFFEVLL